MVRPADFQKRLRAQIRRARVLENWELDWQNQYWLLACPPSASVFASGGAFCSVATESEASPRTEAAGFHALSPRQALALIET
jgi:hypothetical protein